MTSWGWMILGAVLLGAELFAIDAQFYLIFCGIAAALVGAAGLMGIAMPEWGQWLAFAMLSLVFMFGFRKTLYEKLRGGAKGFRGTMQGEIVNIKVDLAPGAEVRSEYRGSTWTMRNVGDSMIAGGSRAVVVKVDGLTLHVVGE
jgi:membrane protein implicated in regulation of membrane protease activity